MSRWLVIPLFILFVSASIAAQSQNVNKSATRDEAAKEKAARELEAERILKERRANAQSLLLNLAVDARNFGDQTLRARTLARIADALWETDRDRGRTIFRAAWDAAEIADKESDERFQEAQRQAQAKAPGDRGRHVNPPPDIRREVLRLATKHDRGLGEEFLAKLKVQKKEASDGPKRPGAFGQTDEAIQQRLGIAMEMLRAGDTDQALEFADPALTTVSVPAIDFLSYLREKDTGAADRRYAAMLAAAASPQTDANRVSWLSSYVFTPHLFVTYASRGTDMIEIGSSADGRHPPIAAAEVRANFIRTAASILLRPPAQERIPFDNNVQSDVINRLLPWFEQFAPMELTAALRNQLVALSSLAGNSGRKRSNDRSPEEDSDSGDSEPDLKSLLNRLERARTSAQRDELCVQVAEMLANKGNLQARDYVDKIDESELRNRARAFIDATLAAHAVEAKKADLALEIARIGDLTHLQKSWLLAQMAKVLAIKDRDKALTLIEESAAEARRMNNSDSDRPRAFLSLANALLEVNRLAVWDLMSDAIKAANSADTFTGEDGQISIMIETKQSGSINNMDIPDFDVAGIFGKLANEDFEKSIELARGFEREAPRANATIAIARSVLEKKKK